jgi:hypothetical protein
MVRVPHTLSCYGRIKLLWCRILSLFLSSVKFLCLVTSLDHKKNSLHFLPVMRFSRSRLQAVTAAGWVMATLLQSWQ